MGCIPNLFDFLSLQLLERYINVVGKKKLQYYWNPSFNLFQESDATFLRDLHNRLLYFQKDLKSDNADKIKKHFGCDVDVGGLGGLLKGLGIKDDSGACKLYQAVRIAVNELLF